MKHLELIPPHLLSATARAAEIAVILANAIVRTQRPEGSTQSADPRAVVLGFLPGKSVHPTPYPKERM